jgi:hypothetical protein
MNLTSSNGTFVMQKRFADIKHESPGPKYNATIKVSFPEAKNPFSSTQKRFDDKLSCQVLGPGSYSIQEITSMSYKILEHGRKGTGRVYGPLNDRFKYPEPPPKLVRTSSLEDNNLSRRHSKIFPRLKTAGHKEDPHIDDRFKYVVPESFPSPGSYEVASSSDKTHDYGKIIQSSMFDSNRGRTPIRKTSQLFGLVINNEIEDHLPPPNIYESTSSSVAKKSFNTTSKKGGLGFLTWDKTKVYGPDPVGPGAYDIPDEIKQKTNNTFNVKLKEPFRVE